MNPPVPFGKYELLERIATGGMAEIYLARSFGLAGFEKRLVIKRIRPELAEDPRFVKMFINEAKIGVHLNHPNVVQVYELGRVAANYYIAMEHLHGRDLTRLVKTLRAAEERLPLPVAVNIVAETCRGLAYAHGRTDSSGHILGLVHQDVSPHNILVTFAGEVKLVDFGIARLMNTTVGSEKSGTHRPGGGKYAYMSPEQALGHQVDHRTDVFSTGIVLWELIVGRRLFQHPDPAEKLRRVQEAVIPHPNNCGANIDDALWVILQKALRPDLEERYSSGTLFEEDLRAWLFESRHRVGRSQVADLMKRCFPDEIDRSVDDLQLSQMVADVERLDALDRTHSVVTPGHSGSTGGTPLPGRLPPPVGERKPVAVLMVDVDGLTDLSARVEPEFLFKRHYQLLRWTRRIVDRWGGTVQRAVDDHIMILFGVPRTRPDDLHNSLECALELERRVSELRAKGLVLELAIGVHTGEVTVGQNNRRRIRYVARGNTTRLARRLSAVANHGEVLVSEQVMAAVEGQYALRKGPSIPSRGGRANIPSLLLEGRREGVKRARKGPWVRRGDELEILSASLVDLAAGVGRTLALVGDSGSGKSRLTREIGEIARRRSLPFYDARYVGDDRPLAVFAGLIREVLGAAPSEPNKAVFARAERLSQLGLSPRDLEAIAALFGVEVQHAPDRTELWRAMIRVLTGLGREGALLVVLDDVHYLPQRERGLLAHLIHSIADEPVLLLLTHRGPLPPSLAEVCREINLGPFPQAAQRRMLGHLLEAEIVGDDIADLVERTCEGNPLYIEEMVKYLVAEDRLVVEGKTAKLTRTNDQIREIPHTLNGLVSSRIDALDAASKGTLQLGAIIGATFSESLLAEAAGLDDITPMMVHLASHGLINHADTAGHWTFASELVHAMTLRGILGVQRRDYHRLVANAIETRYHNVLEPWNELLVTHCCEGGRLVDAARYAFHAGESHERKQDLERARSCYRRGLAVLTRAEKSPDTWDARVQGDATLQLRFGAVSLMLGDLRAGEHALQLALDIASDAGLPWVEVRAHIELGRSYLHRGKNPLARAHLGQARALLRLEDDPELHLEALEAAAALAFEEGRNAEAEALWQEALSQAADDPQAVARCQIGLSMRRLRSGQYHAAGPLLETALESAREAGDRILEGRVLNNIGLLHSWSHRYEEALSYYRKALEVREGIGYTRGVVINHHNVGDTHFQVEDWAKAYVAFQRSRELAEEMGWVRGVVLNDVYMAYISAVRGQADVATLLSCTQRARELGDTETTTAGAWLAGRLLLEQGDKEAASSQLQSALEDAERWDLKPMVTVIKEMLKGIEDP